MSSGLVDSPDVSCWVIEPPHTSIEDINLPIPLESENLICHFQTPLSDECHCVVEETGCLRHPTTNTLHLGHPDLVCVNFLNMHNRHGPVVVNLNRKDFGRTCTREAALGDLS